MEQTLRQKAIKWWTEHGIIDRSLLAQKYNDILYGRGAASLTGREIQIIYEKEHPTEIRPQNECTCEIGHPYNNLTCPIHDNLESIVPVSVEDAAEKGFESIKDKHINNLYDTGFNHGVNWQEGQTFGMYKEQDMYLNMQYYMEHCQREGYCTPQDWIAKHKHF